MICLFFRAMNDVPLTDAQFNLEYLQRQLVERNEQ